MENSYKILHLDDSPDDARLIEFYLKHKGVKFSINWVSCKEQYEEALDNDEYDLIFCDYHMPDITSEEALNIRNRKKLLTPFILISGTISEEVAIRLIQFGGSDYIFKDKLQRLPIAMSQAIAKRKLLEEKLKAEQELYDSNERFQLAVKATADAIWDWNLHNNEMFLGENFETLFGYKVPDRKSTFSFWLRHIHPHDKERVIKSLEEAINSTDRVYWDEEYRYIRLNGSFATVVNKGLLIRNENKVAYRMVGAIRDITELTERNNELKQFSFIISHNLNAPLSNLFGLLNLMDDKSLDSHHISLVNMMKESTKQIKQIIDHLSYTLIIKNTIVDVEDVDLLPIFNRAISILQPQIDEILPTIKTQFGVTTIRTKAAYIESIFLNLLSNALKYRNLNRPLEITVTTEPFINGRTRIIFTDNGLGIDMKRNRDKLFGLYQRLHDVADGQGVGLFLIKTQISALGGSIAVESEVDNGTTFTITL